MISYNVKIKEVFFSLLLLLLIFQSVLQQFFSFLQYFDEILCVISGVYILIYILSGKIQKWVFDCVCLIFLFLFNGFVCNIFGIQPPFENVISDAFLQVKFDITIIGCILFFSKHNSFICKSISYVLPVIAVFVLVSFGCAALNILHPIELFTSEYRYGLPSFRFIFGSHGNMNAISMFWLICLNFGLNIKNKKVYIFLIALDLLVMLFTLRSRAFVCVGLYLWFVCHYRFKINKTIASLVAVFIILLLGGNTFESYFLDSASTQRGLLVHYGIESFKEQFPLGYGFSTYGSFFSSNNGYYSPLYELYGLNTVYGLTRDNPAIMNDNYWPMIIGQFGIIGLIIIVVLYICIFKKILTLSKTKTKENKILVLLLSSMLLINSVSSSSFVHPHSICYAILISVSLFYKKSVKHVSIKERRINNNENCYVC